MLPTRLYRHLKSIPQYGITRAFSGQAMADSAPNPVPVGFNRNDQRKRPANGGGHGGKKQRWNKEKPAKEGSTEEVLIADIRALLAAQNFGSPPPTKPEDAASTSPLLEKLPSQFEEIEVTVLELSSTGDGLAQATGSNQIYVVPFTAPGDTVKIKVIKHFEKEHYTLADFLEVVTPSPLRDDSRISCKYFAKCSGCQFQMLDYPEQLKHKKSIVEKAYKNFSNLPPELLPIIGDTIGSPLQYGYRTKLTPHFDGPPGSRSRTNKKAGIRPAFESVPPIGFMQKGQRKTLDIEDCPIGTDAIRMGMKRERAKVVEKLDKYQKGATILLRESTNRIPTTEFEALQETEKTPSDTIIVTSDIHTDLKTCITDNKGTSTEYIDSFVFTNIAGSFFQNNNSILPPFTQYIRDHILPPTVVGKPDTPKVQYLIDAYCGSGLFTITLSSLFKQSTGIDISVASIDSARLNAELNNITKDRAAFIAADAPELFKAVEYPADETVVVIDPPRKGCDESFLNQLLKFAPKRVIYVSCNVHTQARDVGVLVSGKNGVAYKVESLCGFDFFPQTGHVEGVAVLSRIEQDTPDL